MSSSGSNDSDLQRAIAASLVEVTHTEEAARRAEEDALAAEALAAAEEVDIGATVEVTTDFLRESVIRDAIYEGTGLAARGASRCMPRLARRSFADVPGPSSSSSSAYLGPSTSRSVPALAPLTPMSPIRSNPSDELDPLSNLDTTHPFLSSSAYRAPEYSKPSPESTGHPTSTVQPTSSGSGFLSSLTIPLEYPSSSAKPTWSGYLTSSTNPTWSGYPTSSTNPTWSGFPTSSANPTSSGYPTSSRYPTSSGYPTSSANRTSSYPYPPPYPKCVNPPSFGYPPPYIPTSSRRPSSPYKPPKSTESEIAAYKLAESTFSTAHVPLAYGRRRRNSDDDGPTTRKQARSQSPDSSDSSDDYPTPMEKIWNNIMHPLPRPESITPPSWSSADDSSPDEEPHPPPRPPPEQLRDIILNARNPLVLRKFKPKWKCFKCSLEHWCRRWDRIEKKRHKFDCMQKKDGNTSPHWERKRKKVHMTAIQFLTQTRKLEDEDIWEKFNHKRDHELPIELRSDVNFDIFGFPITPNDAHYWLGSKTSNTPCHYDTYGCNIVVQVYGRKSWLLFPPDTPLHSTRIPYDESSVYATENIFAPNHFEIYRLLDMHKDKVRHVVLEPGDVLIVPHHWWHYVEAMDVALSVNYWVPLKIDYEAHIEECIVRYLVERFATGECKDVIKYLVNPNHRKGLDKEDAIFKLLEVLYDNYYVRNPHDETIRLMHTGRQNYHYLNEEQFRDLLNRMPENFINEVPVIPALEFRAHLMENAKRLYVLTKLKKTPPLTKINRTLMNAVCSPNIVQAIKKEFFKRQGMLGW